MSSRGTTTSSLAQMYCCLTREPQALCSMLKEIARLASVAEKSLTGMETSPKETVRDAIERAAMAFSPELLEVKRGTDCNTKGFLQVLTPCRAFSRLNFRVKASRQR